MTFYNYLKAARERCGISQSDLAEKIGVSTTTIQNWEKDTLPDKIYWGPIIEQLQLSKNDFLKQYADTVLPSDDEADTQPFPDFLFPDHMLTTIKKMRLTADEQELMGLQEIYRIEHNLLILPYEYVQRVGAFQIMNLSESISNKLGGFRGYVIEQIKKKPEDIFDIMKCSPTQLLNLCGYIKINDKYGNFLSTWEEKILDIVDLLTQIKMAGNSLVIAETYDDNLYHSGSWKKLDNYSSFVDYNGKLNFNQFMQLTEKECQDVEYIAAKEKYEKDRLYYEEHSSMLDHEPKAPKYKGTENVEMTEQGKQLLTWYEENFPEEA